MPPSLELADARADQQRVVLLEDHDRIARDLHDHVIQRLFALGLTLEGLAAGLGDDARVGRLAQVVTDIDRTSSARSGRPSSSSRTAGRAHGRTADTAGPGRHRRRAAAGLRAPRQLRRTGRRHRPDRRGR